MKEIRKKKNIYISWAQDADMSQAYLFGRC